MRCISTCNRFIILLVATVLIVAIVLKTRIVADTNEGKSAAAAPEPVDDSMHHFMEYVFEPNYKRLKASLAEEPADKAAWKAVKGDSLTLAEGSNLLLLRAPVEGGDDWRALSVEVREAGGALYQAARSADYATARKSYEAMLHRCNACHTQFADGEHQLEP